jgi:hypothetical protein
MTYEDNIQTTSAEPNAQAEDVTLQMEELEALVAPSAVWGS